MRIFRSWLVLVVAAMIAFISTGLPPTARIADAHGAGSIAPDTGPTPYSRDRFTVTHLPPFFARESLERF